MQLRWTKHRRGFQGCQTGRSESRIGRDLDLSALYFDLCSLAESLGYNDPFEIRTKYKAPSTKLSAGVRCKSKPSSYPQILVNVGTMRSHTRPRWRGPSRRRLSVST